MALLVETLDDLDHSESSSCTADAASDWAHQTLLQACMVLTVCSLWLQRECGVKDPMRVAPLFETLDDLDHSESAMEQLLGNPWYSAHIKGEQECMIGYSDSGKDAGRMAAAWGLYKVQVGFQTGFCRYMWRRCAAGGVRAWHACACR